jgi:signal transduction histidine kinase/streptogramin lyase
VVRDGKRQAVLEVGSRPVRVGSASSSGLWICDGPRVLRYHEGLELEEVGSLPVNVSPRVLLEDRSGALWIGTGNDGLFRLAGGVMAKVPTSHQEVDCLQEDREGNLWAGTNGGGLDQIRPRAMVLIGREAGLPSDSVRSVCEDAAGGLWVVLQNGMLARSQGDTWAMVEASGTWPGEGANCVTDDREGGVWVGSRNRGLHHFTNGEWLTYGRVEGLASIAVRSVLTVGDGSVWIATDSPRRLQRMSGGRFQDIRMPADLSQVRSIRAMAEAADGTVWIGTAGGEVMRASGGSLMIDPVISETHPSSVRSLHTTPDGALWIGYAGGGIGRYKDGRYSNLTSSVGLMDDHVSQMLSDDKGGMWIAGNHGLFEVGLAELTDVAEGRAARLRSRVFGRAEGLSGLQPSYDFSPSVCRGRDGRLWLAMRNGLLMVLPDKVRDNPEPPAVVLERVSVDDRTAALYDRAFATWDVGNGPLPELRTPASALNLPPGHSKLEFEFAALSFTSPENVHFRYRLENFDRKWIDADMEYHASYPQLPAGSYEFRVIACNNSGLWNETGAALAVVVAPFYWQTWWFRILTLTLFTAVVIAIVRYVSFRRLRERMFRLKQEAALHQERARIARDMHDEVGAKLTRLSLLSEMFDGQADLTPAAKAEVREISETARETILAFDEIVWAVNPRNDTLGDLTHYLCRHAEDFFEGTPTECVFGLPQVIPPLMLSTEVRHQVFLAAKEALNNIMKHANASEVRLSLSLNSTTFELVIEDNGCGFDPTAPDPRVGGGNGLNNLRDRMQGIGGQFDCRSKPGDGTRISFTVPLS